jgi:hypothetical protein
LRWEGRGPLKARLVRHDDGGIEDIETRATQA